MYKAAVMGDADGIFGFASVGLEIFPMDDAAVASKKLHELAENEYAVIFVTEKLAKDISDAIDKYKFMPLPAIIPIPGVSGNTGYGMAMVSQSVEKAVGSDILK